MSIPDTSPRGKRALELAIINAFFLPGSAAHVASAFSTGARKLHAGDVRRIWDAAKASGELPKINRPPRGPKTSRCTQSEQRAKTAQGENT